MISKRFETPCSLLFSPFLCRIHECGHALVSLLTDGTLPIGKITIIPRGNVGIARRIDTRLWATSPMFWARKNCIRGPRSSCLRASMWLWEAEQRRRFSLGSLLGFTSNCRKDRVTTGAENDLQQASQMARRAVYEWGMGSVGQDDCVHALDNPRTNGSWSVHTRSAPELFGSYQAKERLGDRRNPLGELQPRKVPHREQ